MIEINFIILEIFIMMMIFIIIFIFAVISSEISTIFPCFALFLMLLIPFSLIMQDFNILIVELNYEIVPIFKMLPFFSTLINTFMGLYMFIEIIYVQFFS